MENCADFENKELHLREIPNSNVFSLTDHGDKNNAMMNQEVLTLQEMLNSIDFKRKVRKKFNFIFCSFFLLSLHLVLLKRQKFSDLTCFFDIK